MSNELKTGGQSSVWETVNKVPGLLMNRQSRKYYGRYRIGSKRKLVKGNLKLVPVYKWVCLNTTSKEIARLRHADEQKKYMQMATARKEVAGGEATMGGLMVVDGDRLRANRQLRESTRNRLFLHHTFLKRTWENFEKLDPSKITLEHIVAWRDRVEAEGSGYAEIAKWEKIADDRIVGSSAGTVNKVIDCLRRLLDIAVEMGQLHANPLKRGMRGVKLSLDEEKAVLPSAKQMEAIFKELEEIGRLAGKGMEVADFARALAYSGMRKSEANELRWSDVVWGYEENGYVQVRGKPDEAPKFGVSRPGVVVKPKKVKAKTRAGRRNLPLFENLRGVLARIYERRKTEALELTGKPDVPPSDHVFGVKDIEKSLTKACQIVGVPRITHHDLRDAFTTACFERDVKIPVIAAWLGHGDGGNLLLKRYNHVRPELSVAEARKLRSEGGISIAGLARVLGLGAGANPDDILGAVAAMMGKNATAAASVSEPAVESSTGQILNAGHTDAQAPHTETGVQTAQPTIGGAE